MRLPIVAAAAALFSVVALACGPADDLHDRLQPEHPGSRDDRTSVTVVARDVLFVPAELTIPADEEITLELKNEDGEEHDLVIEGIEAGVSEGHDEEDHDAEVAVHVEGGETDSVTFTALEAGTYTFYCTIKGHRDAGMEGTIKVTSRTTE